MPGDAADSLEAGAVHRCDLVERKLLLADILFSSFVVLSGKPSTVAWCSGCGSCFSAVISASSSAILQLPAAMAVYPLLALPLEEQAELAKWIAEWPAVVMTALVVAVVGYSLKFSMKHSSLAFTAATCCENCNFSCSSLVFICCSGLGYLSSMVAVIHVVRLLDYSCEKPGNTGIGAAGSMANCEYPTERLALDSCRDSRIRE